MKIKVSIDLTLSLSVVVPTVDLYKSKVLRVSDYPALLKQPLQKKYLPLDIIDFHDEVLFNCGAYDGDTYCDLNDSGCFSYFVCIEPEPKRFQMLRSRAERSRAKCLNAGVSDHCHEEICNGNTVKFTTIDKIAAESGIIPTYINMDIEGAELSALRGAKQIITGYKPKLAICVYHRDKDIVSIPKFLLECRSDYRFFLRLYDFGPHDLVLYAI